MSVLMDREMRKMLEEVKRANDLTEEGKWLEAREIYRRVRAFARKRKLPYWSCSWSLGVCHDNLGEIEAAFRMVVEAVQHDPLQPAVRNSFEITAARLAKLLVENVHDPATPDRYKLLVDTGSATMEVHVGMARHLNHIGEREEAVKLLESVTTLSPNHGDAWRLLAEFAREQGDDEKASQLEIEAAACENTAEAAVRRQKQP